MNTYTTEAIPTVFLQTTSKGKYPLRENLPMNNSSMMHCSSQIGTDLRASNTSHAIQAPSIARKKESLLSKNSTKYSENYTTQQHCSTSHSIHSSSAPSLALNKLTDFTLDIYSQQWVSIMSEEAQELEFAFLFRQSVDKLSSPFASVRKEGLYEALGILVDFTLQTSTRSTNALRQGSLMESTTMSETNRQSSNPTLHLSNSGKLPSSEWQAGGNVRIQPFDAISYSNLPQSPSLLGEAALRWTRAQRALSRVNLTSAFFHRILLPRTEVRARVGLRELVEVVLTEEEARRWSSVGEGPGTAAVLHGGHPTLALLTAVSFEEQELALRLCQGMCLLLHYQRRCIAEGCFLHYAAEVFQCFLQHVEFTFRQRRRCMLQQHRQRAEGGGATTEAVASYSWPDEGHTLRTTSELVEVNPAQVRVIIALIDAVEAACHYNPPVLMRLVQTGCVKALLNLVYSPCVPVEIRASVLDIISVLLKEVAPFRLTAAVREGQRNDSASSPLSTFNQPQPTASTSTAGALQSEHDKSLLNVMIEQGMSGETNRAFFDGYMRNLLSHNLSDDNLNGTRQQPSSFYMDRATASRFDSSVREWFSYHGLSHTISGVMELRNFRTLTEGPKMELDRTQRRAKQIEESKLMKLLQMIDGKRAEEREN
ncbi:unnamed protein product [Phytomonas sp. Hart1]|nr:unnamed protein product [Phytomonas sp. Hart1]|eukprot:CCW69520.1 unnamed protein product [Phytomonas sp. isolate Hart1]